MKLHEQYAAALAEVAQTRKERDAAVERAERAEHAVRRVDYYLRAGVRDLSSDKVLDRCMDLLKYEFPADDLKRFTPALSALRNCMALWWRCGEVLMQVPEAGTGAIDVDTAAIAGLAEAGYAYRVLARLARRGIGVWQAGQHGGVTGDWFCTLSHKAAWGDVFFKAEHCDSLDAAICRAALEWTRIHEDSTPEQQRLAALKAVEDDDVCSDCQGTGSVLVHAPTCDDDRCALNGDQWSCDGAMQVCGCQEG